MIPGRSITGTSGNRTAARILVKNPETGCNAAFQAGSDDHGSQDRSHTGKAAHMLERRTLLKQAFQGFLILADARGQFL